LALRKWLPVGICLSLSAFAVGRALPVGAVPNALDMVKEAIRLKQFDRAATELQQLAAHGNADAQYLLGVFYLNGLNGPPDVPQARIWMTKAAAQGNQRAVTGLHTMTGAADGLSADLADAGPGAVRPQDFADQQTLHEALWLAAQRGELRSVQALSDHDSVNSHDDFGRGALARAADAGHTKVVESLIQAGATVDCADQYGITALMLAARARHSETVGVLVRAGANANAADHGGNTPLMHAAAGGDVPTIERLLAAQAGVKARNVQDWSALDFAVAGQNTEAARRLADSGATALRHGQPVAATHSIVRAKAPDRDLYAGWTDLAIAASRVSPDLLEALPAPDAQHDPNPVDAAEALLAAARSNAPRSAEAVFGRSTGAGTSARAREALLLAVRSGEDEVVRVLLAHGIGADALSPDGEPAVVSAARAQHIGIIRLLMAAHGKPGLRDKVGTSAAMLAAQSANNEMLRILLDSGAPVEDMDKAGRTALWYAAHAGDVNGVNLLIQHGANVDRTDSAGVSVLAAACVGGSSPVAGILIARHIRVDARTKHGDTALLLAAAGGRLPIVDELLAASADKNAQNQFGDTALIIASRNGDTAVVKRLLAAGADTRIRNRDRATAADIAQSRSFQDVVSLLKG
jgi:ankyrin repeat protein